MLRRPTFEAVKDGSSFAAFAMDCLPLVSFPGFYSVESSRVTRQRVKPVNNT